MPNNLFLCYLLDDYRVSDKNRIYLKLYKTQT